MWTLSQDTGLLLATRMKYTFTNSLIYLPGTNLLISIGKHSDVDWLQTQDCLLLQTADVDLWSNSVDWCRSKSYDLHTSVDRTTRAWEHHCRRSSQRLTMRSLHYCATHLPSPASWIPSLPGCWSAYHRTWRQSSATCAICRCNQASSRHNWSKRESCLW